MFSLSDMDTGKTLKDKDHRLNYELRKLEPLSSSVRTYAPIPCRSKRDFVPNSKKDSTYWMKRHKNNDSARKSRMRRRLVDQHLEKKVLALEKENCFLRRELTVLRKEIRHNSKQIHVDSMENYCHPSKEKGSENDDTDDKDRYVSAVNPYQFPCSMTYWMDGENVSDVFGNEHFSSFPGNDNSKTSFPAASSAVDLHIQRDFRPFYFNMGNPLTYRENYQKSGKNTFSDREIDDAEKRTQENDGYNSSTGSTSSSSPVPMSPSATWSDNNKKLPHKLRHKMQNKKN